MAQMLIMGKKVMRIKQKHESWSDTERIDSNEGCGQESQPHFARYRYCGK